MTEKKQCDDVIPAPSETPEVPAETPADSLAYHPCPTDILKPPKESKEVRLLGRQYQSKVINKAIDYDLTMVVNYSGKYTLNLTLFQSDVHYFKTLSSTSTSIEQLLLFLEQPLFAYSIFYFFPNSCHLAMKLAQELLNDIGETFFEQLLGAPVAQLMPQEQLVPENPSPQLHTNLKEMIYPEPNNKRIIY